MPRRSPLAESPATPRESKTAKAMVRLTPSFLALWDAVAEADGRTRTNLLEVLVTREARRLGLAPDGPAPKGKARAGLGPRAKRGAP